MGLSIRLNLIKPYHAVRVTIYPYNRADVNCSSMKTFMLSFVKAHAMYMYTSQQRERYKTFLN